jgi:hypothetical protein
MTLFRVASGWGETIKRTLPQLVPLVRIGRLVLNQIRYPVAATMLDWRGTVVDGPFAGMRFVHSGMAKFVQLLGNYERSLIPVVDRVIAQRPRVMIRAFWQALNLEDRGEPMAWLHLVPRATACHA